MKSPLTGWNSKQSLLKGILHNSSHTLEYQKLSTTNGKTDKEEVNKDTMRDQERTEFFSELNWVVICLLIERRASLPILTVNSEPERIIEATNVINEIDDSDCRYRSWTRAFLLTVCLNGV